VARSDIHCGDCLDVLRRLPAATADLVYLDPPFATNKRQRGREIHRGRELTFNDEWESLESYLDFMRPRLEAIHRILKPTGSILLHCDWRTCHHLRFMLDEIFGAGGFVNHLIWHYGLGGSSPRAFARKHDDILFHARGPRHYFKPPQVPSTSRRMNGAMKKATDVIAIPSINNMAAERSGYPTQKPLALLKLLVEACSPPQGLVVDPFCGSGTTLVAAKCLGRQWLGIDRNPDAVQVSRARLKSERSRASSKEVACAD
jgi:site-specific DNA-methyltransferase (adenine-specific)